MRRYLAETIALLLTTTAWMGCSHELEGPEPEVSSAADPHIVCNQQLETWVDVQGSGFSPLPIETADEPTLLELPAISLEQTADLTGAAAMGELVEVPDDPENPDASDVRWHSQERMSFLVTEERLGLADGIHRITVTNPNGNEIVFDDALAAVPPPTLDSIEPMAICLAQGDRVLQFLGEGFLDINGALPVITFTSETDSSFSMMYMPDSLSDCTTLPAPAGDTDSCNEMTVTIPAGDLPPDTYTVTVTNPEPANCSSTEPISVEVVPPPDLQSITPQRICTGGGTIGLTGENFREGATVTAGNLEAGTVSVDPGGTSATASFGAGLDPGFYDVTIENPEGCNDTLVDALEVVQGPILFFIDPPVVYNGISTQITLYVSGAGTSVDEVTITDPATGTTIALDHSFDMARGRIQAVVPEGTAAGTYDVEVTSAGCGAALPGGLTVTDELTLTVDEIDPAFGDDEDDTPVSIFGSGFVNTPRAYLNPDNPTATTVASALDSVSFIDEGRLTAVVPAGLPAGPYDLIVVNPTGEVGVLEDAFTVTVQDPPEIDVVLPGEVENDAPETVIAEGSNLADVSTAEWECLLPDGSTMTLMGALGTVTDTTAEVTLDATGLASETVCVLRLFRPDGAFAQYSAVAVTEPASNLADTDPSTEMTTGRRALAVVSGRPTRAARFLYAIGGDNGDPMMPYATSESAPVDVFGNLGTWFEQRNQLPQATTFTDAWTIEPYIYLVGGNDGSGAVSNVWRTKILNPDDAPAITDISPSQGDGAGLGPGVWYYRVSAVLPDADGGETLPSDPLAIQLPESLPDTLLIRLFWSEVPGAIEYNVYRTPGPDMSPDETELLTTVPASMLDYQDDGAATMAGTSPLPLGSHGTWTAMPMLNTPRSAAGVGHATDPANENIHYLYAVGGRNAAGDALDTFEYLTITEDEVTGEQTVAPAWVDGLETLADETATISTPAPRAELAVYSANRITAPRSLSAGEAFIYVVGGLLDTGMPTRLAEAAPVLAGGQLGPFEDIVDLAGASNAGVTYMTGNDFLYLFGGGPTPSKQAFSAEICREGVCPAGTVAPEVINWNNQGWELEQARYLGAGTVESAHVFIVGGWDGTNALTTTETTVW